MPRVPVVTGNSVRLAPRPVAAVQPVQLDNAIAEGVQHFGAQLGATAETVAQIAENRARLDAKAADVDYSAFGSDALYDPENGFMNLGGKNALDERKSVVQGKRGAVGCDNGVGGEQKKKKKE